MTINSVTVSCLYIRSLLSLIKAGCVKPRYVTGRPSENLQRLMWRVTLGRPVQGNWSKSRKSSLGLAWQLFGIKKSSDCFSSFPWNSTCTSQCHGCQLPGCVSHQICSECLLHLDHGFHWLGKQRSDGFSQTSNHSCSVWPKSEKNPSGKIDFVTCFFHLLYLEPLPVTIPPRPLSFHIHPSPWRTHQRPPCVRYSMQTFFCCHMYDALSRRHTIGITECPTGFCVLGRTPSLRYRWVPSKSNSQFKFSVVQIDKLNDVQFTTFEICLILKIFNALLVRTEREVLQRMDSTQQAF